MPTAGAPPLAATPPLPAFAEAEPAVATGGDPAPPLLGCGGRPPVLELAPLRAIDAPPELDDGVLSVVPADAVVVSMPGVVDSPPHPSSEVAATTPRAPVNRVVRRVTTCTA